MGTKRQQGSALLISCIIVAAVALVGCFYFQNVLADIFLLTGAAVDPLFPAAEEGGERPGTALPGVDVRRPLQQC